MKLASLSALGLASVCILVCAAAGCSGASTESTESDAEILPDAAVLAALENGTLSSSDTASSDPEATQGTAATPAFCTDGKLPQAFRNGEHLGARWVAWLWHRFRCCDKVEKFTDAMMPLLDTIDQRAATEQGARRCRDAGIEEGTLEQLDSIQAQCQTDCSAQGEAAGAVEAKTYCDDAIAAGGQLQPVAWSRQAVGLCGFAYQLACDASFLGVTTGYVNAQGACEKYASDPYANIWELSRLKGCDYYQRSKIKPH